MRKYKHRKKLNSHWPLAISLLSFLAFIFLAFIFFKVSTLDKYAYVNNNDGNVEIFVIDSKQDKYTKILVNKDRIVDSSRNFGEYKIGNLWTLGQKNGYNGKLISETITKNLLIPISLWKNSKSTNLNIFQQIKSKFIEKRVKDYDYVLSSSQLPESIVTAFTDSEISEKEPNIKIMDLTGNVTSAEKITKILSVYGVKIMSFSKGLDNDLDCEVGGKMNKLVNIVAVNLSCAKIATDEEYDLVIRIGKVFSTRF